MKSNKVIAREILEDLVNSNSRSFEVNSVMELEGLNQRIRLHYSDSFIGYVNSLNGETSKFLEEFSKFHSCATRYGYRGYSSRKNNGIVDIKPTDTALLRDYERLLTADVLERYELHEGSLTPIKVVAHVPNGNRLIGTLDRVETNGAHNVIILGVSNYSGKIK